MMRHDLIEQVRLRVGAGPHDELESRVLGVLRALAECFGDDGRSAVEAAIVQAGGASVGHDSGACPRLDAALEARVSELTGLPFARARELSQAVCHVLTEEPPADAEARPVGANAA